MDKKYKSEAKIVQDDGNKEHHGSNKKIRIQKKQFYIKLANQMEFYFSPSNLSKDRFLSKMLTEDSCK